MSKKKYTVTTIALLHEKKRYEVGSEIELADDEYQKVASYVRPVAVEQIEKGGKDEQKKQEKVSDEIPAQPDVENPESNEQSAQDEATIGADTGTDGETGESGVSDADADIPEGDKEVTPEKTAAAGKKTTAKKK